MGSIHEGRWSVERVSAWGSRTRRCTRTAAPHCGFGWAGFFGRSIRCEHPFPAAVGELVVEGYTPPLTTPTTPTATNAPARRERAWTKPAHHQLVPRTRPAWPEPRPVSANRKWSGRRSRRLRYDIVPAASTSTLTDFLAVQALLRPSTGTTTHDRHAPDPQAWHRRVRPDEPHRAGGRMHVVEGFGSTARRRKSFKCAVDLSRPLLRDPICMAERNLKILVRLGLRSSYECGECVNCYGFMTPNTR